ncbi:MAG TPA: 2-oxoacid:acceptor oxidoreductase family protein, partial [Gammaproteobacteria bacterium]
MSAGSAPRPISIAVTAIGGQGGGVLADWIRDVAEASGYLVQTTSVPGVAQRTGATVYSITLFPRAAAEAAGLEPVLGLMPVPGDVDIVVAAELMEAGRAIQRGYVTPERTLLITSTHRDYAIEEKSGLGDGRRDGDAVLAAAGLAARQLIGFDMERLARLNDSVISAVLLGVLAASAALPIPRELFEQAIRAGGKGVKASLSAFAAGYD